nr:MAG TPA: Serine/threonine-protein kinase MEC1 [Caudoviricetes sp.]
MFSALLLENVEVFEQWLWLLVPIHHARPLLQMCRDTVLCKLG